MNCTVASPAGVTIRRIVQNFTQTSASLSSQPASLISTQLPASVTHLHSAPSQRHSSSLSSIQRHSSSLNSQSASLISTQLPASVTNLHSAPSQRHSSSLSSQPASHLHSALSRSRQHVEATPNPKNHANRSSSADITILSFSTLY